MKRKFEEGDIDESGIHVKSKKQKTDSSTVNTYQEIFLTYQAAKKKLYPLSFNRETADNAETEFKKKASKLADNFRYLFDVRRVEHNNYTFFLACLFGHKEALRILLNHRGVDPNSLLRITTLRETNNPEYFSNYTVSDSLIGWIIAADEDGSIGTLLLQQEELLKESIVVTILCCQIKTAIQRNNPDSVIRALKQLTRLRNNFLFSLLMEFESNGLNTKPIFSYIVKDNSFNWIAEFERALLCDLDHLFYGSNHQFACDLIGSLLEDKKFHTLLPTLVVECCAAQVDLSTFKLICTHIGKLSIQGVYQTIVLPLLNKVTFCGNSEKEMVLKSELKRLWLTTISFPTAKLLLAHRVESATNPCSFFHMPKELVRKIVEDYIQVEQNSYNM